MRLDDFLQRPGAQYMTLRRELFTALLPFQLTHQKRLALKTDLLRVRDEVFAYDAQGYVFHIPSRHSRMDHHRRGEVYASSIGQIFASLNETKKVRYKPQYELHWEERIAAGSHWDDKMRFYRAEHADTAPFLTISSIWLVSASFQTCLQRHLPSEVNSSLEQSSTGFYVPRRKAPYNPRETGVRLRPSVFWQRAYEMCWDDESSRYVPAS